MSHLPWCGRSLSALFQWLMAHQMYPMSSNGENKKLYDILKHRKLEGHLGVQTSDKANVKKKNNNAILASLMDIPQNLMGASVPLGWGNRPSLCCGQACVPARCCPLSMPPLHPSQLHPHAGRGTQTLSGPEKVSQSPGWEGTRSEMETPGIAGWLDGSVMQGHF